VEGLATTADGRDDPKLDKMGIDLIDYRNANRLSRLQPATVLFGVTVTSSHETATPLRYGVTVIWPEISRRPTACAC
jgi:hypothetical protein